MNAKIAEQIQAEQDHGRQKYGGGGLAKDDANSERDWASYIADHNQRALCTTPQERRQHLVKVAGLAVSAIEAMDRRL